MTGNRRAGRNTSRKDPHGKISTKDSLDDLKARVLTSLPVLPRASSRINDNHCYNRPQGRLLAGSTSTEQTLNSNLNVNLHVVTPVPSAHGPPQKKGVSPGVSDCHLKRSLLNSVKGVSCVTQLSCVNPVTNVKNAAQNLPVGTSFGGRSKGCSNPQRGLHPPLSDPAKTGKISHGRKLLCQSPQEQLPVGGITSAYRQKSHRTGKASNFSRIFQPTISSSKTQQQMEANAGSKQTKPFPQGGEIQNGDTRNHQNIPPTRGVGHLSRLQGCLLLHTNTGTIQEIPKISYPGLDLPIQGIALWPVHSAHGVHCVSKGGETDGHTQGYKNPPVPRRLVGESQIPRNLSPTHPNPNQNVPGPRLAGEFREIRAGAQTGLRLCRLPIRPQVRPGQTDPGPVAMPSGQDTSTPVTTGLSGPAVHVPDRSANSHRKTGSPRPTAHETHTVASQKQLEGTRISTKVPAPSLTMVARGRQCASRSTISPIRHALQIFTDASKEGWSAHLNEFTARGSWSVPESKLHINYQELKAMFLAVKEFQDLCVDKIVLVATDNTTVVAYINKEGGMRSGPLCALLWRILTWCSQ